MSFSDDIDAFSRKSINLAGEYRRKLAFEMFRKTLKRTPVGAPHTWKSGKAPKGYREGTLKRSWSINGRSNLTNNNIVTLTLNNSSNAPLVMSNKQPYAYRIEYAGWSKQAPMGMITPSLAEVKRMKNKLK
jgi:hypothetical protein